jgi:hypothetical protein
MNIDSILKNESKNEKEQGHNRQPSFPTTGVLDLTKIDEKDIELQPLETITPGTVSKGKREEVAPLLPSSPISVKPITKEMALVDNVKTEEDLYLKYQQPKSASSQSQ